MVEYALEFEPGWDFFFNDLDAAVKAQLWKKIIQLKQPLKHRHLKHGAPFFVEEVGGCRVAFKVFEDRVVKRVYFAGTHKQYRKWYSGKE